MLFGCLMAAKVLELFDVAGHRRFGRPRGARGDEVRAISRSAMVVVVERWRAWRRTMIHKRRLD
jgi:hypothetical protein